MSKSLFLSKTFWVNVLGVIIGIGGYVTGLVPAEYEAIAVSGLAFLNVVLRTMTKEPVHITEPK